MARSDTSDTRSRTRSGEKSIHKKMEVLQNAPVGSEKYTLNFYCEEVYDQQKIIAASHVNTLTIVQVEHNFTNHLKFHTGHNQFW